MDDDVKAEFEKLKKEVTDLKKQNARYEASIKQLSGQLIKLVKQFKSVKETTRQNSGALEGIKNILRNMGR